MIRMNTSRRIECAGNVGRVRWKGITYWVFVRKSKAKRVLRRHSCRWEDNIN